MGHHSGHRAQQAVQPRPSLADQLDRIIPRVDKLTQRARLTEGHRTAAELHDMEEEAQAIAAAFLAPFRGPANNPPRYVSADGMKAAW